MVILQRGEKLCICAEEKDIKSGKKRFQIMFHQRIYDSKTFNCVSDPTQRLLYPHLRSEFTQNKAAAIEQFDKLNKMFNPEGEAPVPEETPTIPVATPGVGAKLEEILIKTIAEQSVDDIVKIAKPMLDKHIIDTFGVLPQKHEVVTPEAKHEFEGVTHEKFDDVLNLVSLDVPVFLTGAAGTGKNVICKQVAEGLGLDFYFTNAVTQEYQLKGFIDANGTYHETQFFKAFTQGGLFFLDEMDGSIPETLIILNAAIANKYFDFPTGKFEAHPNFRVIAAGNTIGTGADIEYTGRFQLDAASLDRFALVNINYSENIENALTDNNYELCGFARKFRKITSESGIRCLFSYRAIERISKLENSFELPEVLKMSLTKGLSKDDIRIIVNGFEKEHFENKYTQALRKVR